MSLLDVIADATAMVEQPEEVAGGRLAAAPLAAMELHLEAPILDVRTPMHGLVVCHM